MSCREKIRERRAVKLDGWDAYIRAIGAQLEFDGSPLDRVQAGKRGLRDRLDRLESEANQSESLANRARANLLRASNSLRVELSSPRPNGAAAYVAQKRAIGSAIAEAEHELNAIAASVSHNEAGRLGRAIEYTMRAMVALEAELEVADWVLGRQGGRHGDLSVRVGRDFPDRLRSLSAAVATARKLSDGSAKPVEAEIASSIGWLRDLFATR
ncbi:MAG TPA: hypothetical protein VMH36_00760 [Alphaproteobacteria bacterium]|nr:hypothetical protein [Alphaproteobacteria bacterium]